MDKYIGILIVASLALIYLFVFYWNNKTKTDECKSSSCFGCHNHACGLNQNKDNND